MPRPQKSKAQNLIGLNDDEAEKRRRRSSIRQAAEDSRRVSLATTGRDSLLRPTPSESTAPLMANFEEWMKLVKDNKINPSNSWNFALIDYFHDMAVLKEGDKINFQKASYTLDGCVKIYTSRVDSVASETGKLLSGLADSGKELRRDDENTGTDDEGVESQRAHRRRKNRSDTTLASDFSQILVKNLDLELSVDPLFRKMCSDFNEGGTRGLLLNSLGIDNTGRIVFDGQVDQQPEENSPEEVEEDARRNRHIESIDLSSIRKNFFPGLSNVDSLTTCPSLKILHNALKDPSINSASDFIKDIENIRIEEEGAFAGDINDFDDDDNGFELDPAMGEEEESLREFGVPDLEDRSSTIGDTSADSIPVNTDGITVVMNTNHEGNIMAYFDETLRKNWAGPEHWKIQKIKGTNGTEKTQIPKRRIEKVKEPFFIDFFSSEGPDENELFAKDGSSLNMPKHQYKSKTRNMLPNDEHFSSQALIKLFLKPNAQVLHKGLRTDPGSENSLELDVDENFFAENYQNTEDTGSKADYDANFFFGGSDATDRDFDDDYDGYGPSLPQPPDSQNALLSGSQSAHPEYLNYARSAKKVNIKLLKDNIWKTLYIPESKPVETISNEECTSDRIDPPEPVQERKFTDMVQDLKSVYAPQQMSEISTSFCFICLLHLANEKGLVIENNVTNTELTIRKDMTVTAAELSA